MDLPFAESRMNMKWPQILKTVGDDAIGFFEDGGWKNVLDFGTDVRRTRCVCPRARALSEFPNLAILALTALR